MRRTTLRYDDVGVGEELPALDVEITATRIVAGAIASRDYRPMHHDKDFAIHRNGVRLDTWRLDATPEKARDQALVRKLGNVQLSRGDRVSLRLVPDAGEQCRVDAIEIRGRRGRVRRIEAESMELGRGAVVEAAASSIT